MRFRLRTLLIVFSLACMFLAWANYVRRMERFHQSEESRHIGRITATESVLWTGLDTAKLQRGEYVSGMIENFVNQNGRWVSQQEHGTHKVTKTGDIYFRGLSATVPGDAEHWQLAIHHRLMADKYRRSLFQPWLLLSE